MSITIPEIRFLGTQHHSVLKKVTLTSATTSSDFVFVLFQAEDSDIVSLQRDLPLSELRSEIKRTKSAAPIFFKIKNQTCGTYEL